MLQIIPRTIERALHSRALPNAALAGALLVLSWQLAQATWRLWLPRSSAVASSTLPALDVGALGSTNLFGTPAPRSSSAAGGAPPRSALNLVLTGVAARERGGCALIVAGGEPEWAYCAGDEILPGVRLDGVRADRVFVLRNGAREVVLMRDLAARAAPPGGNAVRVDRAQLQQQLARPESLMQALIVPNPGGGLLVRSVEAASVYEKLGLRAGDVVRAINGQPLSSVEDVMRLYRQFGSAERLAVEVQRGGRPETLYYEVH